MCESSVKMEENFVKPSEISSANCVYNQYFSRLDIISDWVTAINSKLREVHSCVLN